MAHSLLLPRYSPLRLRAALRRRNTPTSPHVNTAVADAVKLLPAPLAPACPELLVEYLVGVFEDGDARPAGAARCADSLLGGGCVLVVLCATERPLGFCHKEHHPQTPLFMYKNPPHALLFQAKQRRTSRQTGAAA
jgi:hypothetical protein